MLSSALHYVAVQQCPTEIKVPGAAGVGCYTFELSAMTKTTFIVNDTYPEPYLVAAPCMDADTSRCDACNGKSHAVSSAYQVECTADRCFSLNDNGGGIATSTPNADPKTGLSLLLTGGDGGRTVTYDLVCDPTATGAGDRPSSPIHTTPMKYVVTWPTASACPTYVAGETCVAPTPAPTPLPKPTGPQLEYQQHEMMALIHFNMATFAHNGDPGCNADNWAKKASYAAGPTNNASTFWPAQLNTTQWMESIKDLGARHATITAKHGCGFLNWATKSTLPDGSPYGYDVGHGFGRSVLHEFTSAAEKAGVGHGFYYSLTNNFYLNVASHVAKPGPALPGQQLVTQAQFEAIALAQVAELWTEFGSLTEIWFDGGYTSDMKAKITALLDANQPNVSAFGGLGVTPNAICWVGTESGNPGGEIWSTGSSHLGDANSPIWCPKGCDTTLQNFDVWFYEESSSLRTLAELIDVYHATVGMNGMLELDFAIDRSGLVHPTHAARYKELGDWIRACYPDAHAHATSGTCSPAKPCVLELEIGNGDGHRNGHRNGSIAIDRAMVQENLAEGQLVRSYKIELVTAAGATVAFSTGHSVGNKRIDVVSAPVANVVKARLTVSEYVGATLTITRFAVYPPCPAAH
jgi:alpha-L-fucosidase